jgi:hypothetical protein
MPNSAKRVVKSDVFLCKRDDTKLSNIHIHIQIHQYHKSLTNTSTFTEKPQLYQHFPSINININRPMTSTRPKRSRHSKHATYSVAPALTCCFCPLPA